MEPAKIIAVFLKWLQYNPAIFLPKAWKNLPQLDLNLADSADDELFPVAHTISKWCAQNALGEKLKEAAANYKSPDIDAPPEFDITDTGVIENLVPVLRQSIQEAYEALLREEAEQQAGGENE